MNDLDKTISKGEANLTATGDVPELNAGVHAMAAEKRAAVEKSLKRKLDFYMLPLIVLVYILNYLDRNSISQARLSGLEKDLGLSDTQYQTALSLVFVLYISMQIPSNLMLAWCGKPSYYLGTAIALWGIVSGCTGATHNFGELAAVRLFLGLTEAVFFPGALFLLSEWYTKRELAVRMALLYAGSILSNAFAGLIAAGIIGGMEGVHGLAAWRWLMILEGSITTGVGLIIMVILPDFPRNSSTLIFTREELDVAVWRIAEDSGDATVEGEKGTPWQGFILAIKDIKVWVLTIMMFGAVTGLSFNIFMPTLVKTLGYGKIETLLLTTPVWLFAFIIVYLNALHADKTGERFWHMSIPLAVGIVGFIIASATSNIGARFFAMFIMASSYAGYVITLSWVSNSIPRPAYKRAVALALANCISNTGNIVGSYIYPEKWGPSYWQSFTISAACFLVTIALGAWLKWHLTQLNKELDRSRGETGQQKVGSGALDEEQPETQEERMLRARQEFRYLV
ncbi:unnamed protein product [Sympodiomycopsis kandeliae]